MGGLIVGRFRGGVDIREVGSGNAGGTNALRTQGAAFAFWVMVIDVGKAVYYALDEAERQGVLDRLTAEGVRGKPQVTRFKGLGEMNPLQLRETTMLPESRRLVQLTIDAQDDTEQLLDMLLAKKRASDRRAWLEIKGNLAEI